MTCGGKKKKINNIYTDIYTDSNYVIVNLLFIIYYL